MLNTAECLHGTQITGIMRDVSLLPHSGAILWSDQVKVIIFEQFCYKAQALKCFKWVAITHRLKTTLDPTVYYKDILIEKPLSHEHNIIQSCIMLPQAFNLFI